ncbi:MAG TPA: metallophosphoesterase [Bacillota bacterium]|nr:metallophosphoesterase [Bacillota bacterium]
MLKKRLTLFVMIVAAAAVIFLFLLIGNEAIQISRFDVGVAGLPENHAGLKIVHISDLHGKEFGPNNGRLAGAIIRLEPDLVFVSGDMIDSRKNGAGALINLLRELDGRFPVYCSLGNHEQIVKELTGREKYRAFTEQVRAAGAILLDNERVEYTKDGVIFGIYGFTAALYHYTGSNIAWEGADLQLSFIVSALGRPQEDEITVLLAHNPKYFQEYVSWGADLVLAGHIHGGVIRLPVLGGVFSPDLSFFPPYSAGLYHSGNTTMHVSRGLGNSVIPVRIFNRPDLSLIQLKPAPANLERK